MATEPIKISEMTQAQRNAIIAALGCKTVHRMNNGDSLPVGFSPDEILIMFSVIETEAPETEHIINLPPYYYPSEIQADGYPLADMALTIYHNALIIVNYLPDSDGAKYVFYNSSIVSGLSPIEEANNVKVINNSGNTFDLVIKLKKFEIIN